MNKKTVALLILDGQGIGDHHKGDAVFNAKTPVVDKLQKEFGTIQMKTFGEVVGLPEGQMGNSEVGHTNIGAGRVVRQGLSKINFAIDEDKSFYDNEVVLKAINYAKENNSNFHILGLISPGGVHAHIDHVVPIIEMANKQGVKVNIHAFTDGRDVSPTSAKQYIKQLQDSLKGKDAQIVSISGRYYAMDRDTKWERTMLSYKAITLGEANTFDNILDYIDAQSKDGITDEFIKPAINAKKDGLIKDNDSIFFINFRPDRARQLSHLFIGSKLWDYKPDNQVKNIYFASMMNYDKIECDIAFPPVFPKNTLGEWTSSKGLSQMRAAETEKYPHVTFFFDGGEEHDWPKQEKILVKSPQVATYDLQPEMSAIELTDKIVDKIKNFDLAIINFANPDMVGHTGDISAVQKAVETVDTMVGRIYEEVVVNNGGILFITADHGNADKMIEEDGSPMTKHSVNPVPVTITTKDFKIKEEFVKNYQAKLADIAPTLLTLMGVEIPKEMTGEVLIKK